MTCIITSTVGVVAKYCDKHISVCVCLSVSRTTCVIFTNFLCTLPMAMARSSSSSSLVTKSQGERAILGVFIPTDNALYGPYCGMNFATKDQFGLNLLVYHKL